MINSMVKLIAFRNYLLLTMCMAACSNSEKPAPRATAVGNQPQPAVTTNRSLIFSISAKLLGVHESKLSEIMNRKRPADVAFLKAAHQKSGIDGNLLLLAV